MQTGLKLFDLSIQTPSFESRRIGSASTKQGEASPSDQFAGFMEIMSALMTLPPEHWKNSLPDLEAISFDAGFEPLSSLIDPTREEAAASEMLQLFKNLNGNVKNERQDTETQDKANLFIDMARAFMNAHGPFASIPVSGDVADWKAKWLQIAGDGGQNELPNSVPADQSPQSDASEAARTYVQNEILVRDFFPDRNKTQIQIDSNPDSEPDSKSAPDMKASTSETLSEDILKPFSPEKDSAARRAEHSVNEIRNRSSDAQSQQPDAGSSKTVAAGKSGAEPFQSISDSQNNDLKMDAQSIADGDNPEQHSTPRLSAPSDGFHGLQSRIESRQDQTATCISGGQEAMPSDKKMQSDIIRQIVQRMSMHTQGSQSKMVIRLQPEILGDVHMHILTENHQVTVKMMTDSLAVKEIVEQNLQHLRSELQQHGLQIQKFDVFVANDDQGWKRGQDQSGFKNAFQKKPRRSDGIQIERVKAKAVSGVGKPQRGIQKNPNEIDYFA